MSRLATGIWVSAYLKRLQLEGIAAYIAARGDETAGAVLVKLATMDGQAVLYQRSYDLLTDTRRWEVLTEGEEREVDASVARQRGFDGDLWVVEVEDPRGRHLLDQEGLDA
ncbi:MAG: GTP-binding protein Era [Rhodobacterales bacterium]|nr:MAG: GTP-binding protein Era [Rhodobacterales bacterium]